LEDDFGPVWLRRHLERTRKLSEEEQAFHMIEQELQKAEQAKNVEDVIWEDEQREERIARFEGRNLSDPKTFGVMLSPGKRARIEDWRNDGVVDAGLDVRLSPTQTNPSAIVVDDPIDPLASEDLDNISMAEGWMRRKIDAYNELNRR
jgi:hypothetical protein